MSSLFDYIFKSRIPTENELEGYYRWAYPYGDTHKEKINELISKVLPDEEKEIAIYNYLITRQELAPKLYEGPVKVETETFALALKKLKKQFYSKSKKNIYKYFSLVETDLKIDDNLDYPSVEDIINRAEEIEELLK